MRPLSVCPVANQTAQHLPALRTTDAAPAGAEWDLIASLRIEVDADAYRSEGVRFDGRGRRREHQRVCAIRKEVLAAAEQLTRRQGGAR
jgi:hypothetical protein